MAKQESYLYDMLYRKKGRCTMTELNVSQIIENCEANAIPDDEIDTSVIPPITDFNGFDFGQSEVLPEDFAGLDDDPIIGGA